MKQTAANNQLLAAIKRIFNDKIYKKALGLMNTKGEAATVAYVQQFVTVDVKQMLGVQ